LKKEFLKISEEILEISEKYRNLNSDKADEIADLFQELFVVFLSLVKNSGKSKAEVKETIYNVLFGEVVSKNKDSLTFNNIDMDLLDEIKSSISEL
jgi:hypothetical protein